MVAKKEKVEEGVYLKLFRKKKLDQDETNRQRIKEMEEEIIKSLRKRPVDEGLRDKLAKKKREEIKKIMELPEEREEEAKEREEKPEKIKEEVKEIKELPEEKKEAKEIKEELKKTEEEPKREVTQVLKEEGIKSGKYDTDIDVLYKIIEKKGRVKLSVLAKYFGVDKNKIEEWTAILQEHGLLDVYYPAIGEPELMKFGLSKEERKKILQQQAIEKKELSKQKVIEKKEPKKEVAKKEEVQKEVKLGKLGFFKKMGLIVKNPKDFFNHIKLEAGIRKALVFYVLIFILMFILQMIVKIVVTFVKNPILGIIAIIGSLAGSLILIPVILLVMIILVFLMAGLYHVLVIVFKGKNPFSATFKAVVYASVPGVILSMLNGLPYFSEYVYFALSSVAFLWGIVVLVVGIAIMQDMGYGKAFMVAIIPTLIIIGLVLLAGYIYFGGFYGVLGYIKANLLGMNTPVV